MTERSTSKNLSRRVFLRQSTTAAAGPSALGTASARGAGRQGGRQKTKRRPIHIATVDSNFEREPLIRPFGFKGGFITEIWQAVSFMANDSGSRGVGLGSQSVLWSDAEVFAAASESGGNALMYALTERALQMARGQTFSTPIQLQEAILEEVYAYGKQITTNPRLRKTFALNALVGVDNAAWLLYAHENGIKSFDEMIPEAYDTALPRRHTEVAALPTVGYTIPIPEMKGLVEAGYFFLKIKLGQPGTQAEMLEKDKERLTALHAAIGHMRTPHTQHGKVPYYFDANGRYEAKDTLLRFLDHARKIGAFDQIALVEEPFAEDKDIHVGDIDVIIAADECAHTDVDALERIQMGYTAIALKAVAKTLSMTLKIARVAQEHNVPCFCADLTVNPVLLEWNKAVAARLSPLPGLEIGVMETNGHQNYLNWRQMQHRHPFAGASWTKVVDGVFQLNEDYYRKSGGILTPSTHYDDMFAHHRG